MTDVLKQLIKENNKLFEMKNYKLVDFGKAIKALKKGKRVARNGWNGKGMFIFMQVPAKISKDIVPNMQSLPINVKNEFINRFNNNIVSPYADLESISYKNQLAIVYPDNSIYGWVASPSDILEEDWIILD